MKKFNTTGLCVPARHYMVDITHRLGEIKAMVDEGDYFCINRGRQYGKTTTLCALTNYLRECYTVIIDSDSCKKRLSLKHQQEFSLCDIIGASRIGDIQQIPCTEEETPTMYKRHNGQLSLYESPELFGGLPLAGVGWLRWIEDKVGQLRPTAECMERKCLHQLSRE